MKHELLEFISNYENDNIYSSLDRYAIGVIKNKITNDTISKEEKILIVDEFLSNYMNFDDITGEPIGNTIFIEKLINFVLYEN